MNTKHLYVKKGEDYSSIVDEDNEEIILDVYGQTSEDAYKTAVDVMRALVAYAPMLDVLDTVERLARDREELDRRDWNMVQGVQALAYGVGNPPYPEFCRHKDQCAGRGSCPRIPTCAD